MCPWQPPLREDRRQCVSKQDEGGDGERSSCQKLCIQINILLSGFQCVKAHHPFCQQTTTTAISDIYLGLILLVNSQYEKVPPCSRQRK